MQSLVRLVLILSVAIGILVAIPAGAQQSENQTRGGAKAINPKGKWTKFEKGKTVGFLIWYTSGGEWHVGTASEPGQKNIFRGTIDLDGGQFTDISKFLSKLEKNDIGQVNAEKTKIFFEFKTAGKEDSFNFKISPTTKTIIFNLDVDGQKNPALIYIGKTGQHPAAAAFNLPGNP